MGRFGATVHIKNEVGRTEFMNKFCDFMKKQGFVTCEEDEAEKTCLLAFGCGWATLANEDYGSNPRQAYDDCKQIAKALKTSAFSVEIVNSDFAILTLNDGDKVIVGDGSGYGIEEPERGSRKSWEYLLAEGRTFEQFSEIVSRNDTFAEETLCSAADILGVERELICADYDEIMEKSDSSDAVMLCFKKAAEKKLSLNAAFKKVFGEALGPLGFKLIKSKYPYFVKVVSDEIIHYVTIANERADGRGDHGVKYKCFNVFCGISTVYSGRIDFDENHAKFSSSDFIDSIRDIYTNSRRPDYDMEYRASISCFYYDPTSTTDMIKALNKALKVTNEHAIPVTNLVVTLEKCMDYFDLMGHWIYTVSLHSNDESLLCTKLFSADEYVMFCNRRNERNIEQYRHELNSDSELSPKMRESYEGRIRCIMERREEDKKKYYGFFTNPEIQEGAPAELERRKRENTEKLRKYGLNI